MMEDEQEWKKMEKRRKIGEEKQRTRNLLSEPDVHFRQYSKNNSCIVVKPSSSRDRLTCFLDFSFTTVDENSDSS